MSVQPNLNTNDEGRGSHADAGGGSSSGLCHDLTACLPLLTITLYSSVPVASHTFFATLARADPRAPAVLSSRRWTFSTWGVEDELVILRFCSSCYNGQFSRGRVFKPESSAQRGCAPLPSETCRGKRYTGHPRRQSSPIHAMFDRC